VNVAAHVNRKFTENSWGGGRIGASLALLMDRQKLISISSNERSLNLFRTDATTEFFHCPDLKELYSEKFGGRGPLADKWQAVGALDRASNIEYIVAGLRPSIESVLDVGCGNGAVLQQLAEKKIGNHFAGLEVGMELSRHEREDLHIHGFDGRTIPYEDKAFDLVCATHVLEHVTDERGFLHELRRVSRKYVYVEVPCELHLRTSHLALQASLDIGHINAYTPESFALTLETSGLRVDRIKLFEHRYATHRVLSPAWLAMLKFVMRKAMLGLSESAASRIFTYHCGALCRPGPLLADIAS
jgi:SAM-dependent methyltransferase